MTDTIATIMNELKQRRDWNNPEEVEIWFERKLREVKAEAREEVIEIIGEHEDIFDLANKCVAYNGLSVNMDNVRNVVHRGIRNKFRTDILKKIKELKND